MGTASFICICGRETLQILDEKKTCWQARQLFSYSIAASSSTLSCIHYGSTIAFTVGEMSSPSILDPRSRLDQSRDQSRLPFGCNLSELPDRQRKKS